MQTEALDKDFWIFGFILLSSNQNNFNFEFTVPLLGLVKFSRSSTKYANSDTEF